MNLTLTKEFKFEASHILPKHPGKCSRLHGHSWVLRVSVEGEINPATGFVMDYAEMKKCVQPLIDSLDHRHLGTFCEEFEPEAVPYNWRAPLPSNFYPSSENLIVWIANQLEGLDSEMIYRAGVWLPRGHPGPLYNPLDRHFWSKLELNETCTSACTLTRNEFQYV
jgi:6-pyruvoyl tetrahydropterin synthase/QueD family protein